MAKRDNASGRTNSGTTKGSRKVSTKKPVATVQARTRGRSGGVVDAPGKKHRKPLPADPEASLVDSQAAKMRTAMPMTKTNRFRGRG